MSRPDGFRPSRGLQQARIRVGGLALGVVFDDARQRPSRALVVGQEQGQLVARAAGQRVGRQQQTAAGQTQQSHRCVGVGLSAAKRKPASSTRRPRWRRPSRPSPDPPSRSSASARRASSAATAGCRPGRRGHARLAQNAPVGGQSQPFRPVGDKLMIDGQADAAIRQRDGRRAHERADVEERRGDQLFGGRPAVAAVARNTVVDRASRPAAETDADVPQVQPALLGVEPGCRGSSRRLAWPPRWPPGSPRFGRAPPPRRAC